MVLQIINDKVINVSLPKLTEKELEKLESIPKDDKLIKKAVSKKYNVVFK
jgi:hypothetical protein